MADPSRAAPVYEVVLQALGGRNAAAPDALVERLASDLALERADAASLLLWVARVLERASLVTLTMADGQIQNIEPNPVGLYTPNAPGAASLLSGFEGLERTRCEEALAFLRGSVAEPVLGLEKTAGIVHTDVVRGDVEVEKDDQKPLYARQRVFFATDRAAGSSVAGHFGGKRSSGGAMRYGSCEVSIPRDHRMGHLESPSIWRLEFRGNPEKHVMIVSREVAAEEDFFHRLQASDQQEGALLFIHGYNVKFDDAIRGAAQLSYDISFGGPTVAYTWPSRGNPALYTYDEASAEWSEPHFSAFLERLLTSVGTVHVIAHSLGNRLLSRALHEMALASAPRFANLATVVFTAPDVDRDTFENRATTFMPSCGHATLYASDSDKALLASTAAHGATRAGLSFGNPVIVSGIDTIDVTAVNSDFLGHSYFASNDSVVSDVFYLIRGELPPRFRLRPATAPAGPYWRFVP